MKLTKFLQLALLGTYTFSNAVASENIETKEELLIVGCRPWDANIQDVKGLETAHFMDFRSDGTPQPMPARFHHVDVDDNGTYEARPLSLFAKENPNKFKRIVIDWITYQHIHRYTAWADFATLLNAEGELVIPITHSSFTSKEPNQSLTKAEEIIAEKKLGSLFNSVKTLTYDQIPSDTSFDLLRRSCFKDMVTVFNPAIIFASKKNTADKAAIDSPIEKDQKEILLPTLDQIKKAIIQQSSLIRSDSQDEYKLEVIGMALSTLNSTFDGKDFELTFDQVWIAGNSTNNSYRLQSIVKVNPVGVKRSTNILLVLEDNYASYKLEGEARGSGSNIKYRNVSKIMAALQK